MPQAPLSPVEGIDDLILGVERPARYLGGEMNAVVKDPGAVRVRFGLAFPDTYEIGMSNVGFRTLYHALNERPDTACERFFMPWADMEKVQQSRGVPLFSLENRLPARSFDVLGFTLQFELCYPTVLAMLDLAGIPLLAKDRRRDDPLILGGGPCAYNPEPVADFFDAIAVGEGEELVHEISDVVADWKQTSESRRDLLWRLSELGGVYIPSLFRPRYSEVDRTLSAMEPLKPGYERVVRRVVPDLNAVPMPEKPIVPFMQTVHDRLPIEIQRGCTRGCRFCQVGMITRPTRQRSPENVRKIAEAGLASTGYDEVGFLSLSAGDYECINGLLQDFFDRFAPERVSISLPSLRTETMNDKLAAQVRQVRKSGFTVAPEAASERMRRVINKGNKEENLLQAVDSIFKAGWDLVKFYFMIGLPTERDEDVRAIVQLAAKALDLARKSRPNAQINVGVSTFVPKPFTPFQWEPMIPLEETRRKHGLLREELGKLGRRYARLSVKPHDATQSAYEGALALGDRRLGTAILAAYRLGQRFDGWSEHFHVEAWERAMQEMQAVHGVDLVFFAHRARGQDELLPWDHIDCEVTRPYLWRERERARAEAEVIDCVLDRCTACGACDYFTVDTRVYRETAYRPADISEAPVPVAPVAVPIERTTVRLQYAKEGRLRALSHLETKTAVERALRRAALPVAYSQGFSPKPKLVFSPALSLGIESQAEYVDITLVGKHSGAAVASLVGQQLPPGLRLMGWEEAPAESLNGPASAVTYRAELPAESAAGLVDAIARFTGAAEWPVMRQFDGHEKRIDLKPFIRALTAEGGDTLRMELVQGAQGGARPGEVVQSLLGVAPKRLVKESVRLGLLSS
jgi:radical SAM family uncharacterized protein/radical SAM-linked protein